MHRAATIAAGFVSLAVDTAVQHRGLPRGELLRAAALDEDDVADASTLLPCDAFWELLQHILDEGGDRGFGLRMAETLDLRAQGFWGYALLASLTLRQRIEMHLRYQARRSPAEFTFREEQAQAILDVTVAPVAESLRSVFLDWSFGTVCLTHRKRVAPEAPALQLWLDVREQAHHQELRAWATGPVLLGAGCNRIQFPARHLDLPLGGDRHLGTLVRAQLDQELVRANSAERHQLVSAVRARLEKRIATDASLARIARDLRLSERTLRRKLASLGESFQQLLDDVRRTRALAALRESEEPIEAIAAAVGYPDASNFRRAFRRWTGESPRTYRSRMEGAGRGNALQSRAPGPSLRGRGRN